MTKARTPLVSICCLVYNHAPYLQECFDGFLAQRTDFPVEILVHDDASTDNSADIIRDYAARRPDLFRPLYQTENQFSKGIVQMSIHFQFPRATGKYVALCEGDDYWVDPLKLQKQIDWLETHPECGLVYTQVRWFWQGKGKFGKIRGGAGGRKTTLEVLLEENRIPTPTVVIRKELLDRYIEEVQPQNRKWTMGDYPMWLYVAAHSEIHFIPEPAAVYRVLPRSASHFDGYEKAIRFHESAYEIRRYFAERYAPQMLDRIAVFEQWDRLSIAVHYRRLDDAFRIYAALEARGIRPETRNQRRTRRRTLRQTWLHPIVWFRESREH